MEHRDGTSRHAIIVGCGIAGPVIAMFLHRIGISSAICEAAPHPQEEQGAFLELAPNGIDVLRRLGILHDALHEGLPKTSTAFQNHRGKLLGRVDEALVVSRRSAFCEALRNGAEQLGVTIEFGKRLESVELFRDAVEARFADGTRLGADFLIGCDGIHSRTRAAVLPDAPLPEFTGIVDSSAIATDLPLPSTSGVQRVTFGREGSFGYQVMDNGEIYWFENFEEPSDPASSGMLAMSDGDWQQRLLAIHRLDPAPIAEIISSTSGPIRRWPVFDMPVLPSWHSGRACLLGDAAHPTAPHAGQGASLALEDAIVLAQSLRDIPDIGQAFSRYESLRKNRVGRIVKQARRLANHKPPSNSFGRGVRDLVIPVLLRLGASQAQEDHAYRVDWTERAA